jgi:EmrB/QacA subfamily drug resistance transporter
MSQEKKKWLGLTALIPALGMVFTDQTVLPVALPTIQEHLGASNLALRWCINSYLLTSAVFLLAGGKIGDRIGYRTTFLWGMIIFAISSALCGLSFDVAWLIGARALQGVGAALMIPASAPLLMSVFPARERGQASGISVSVSSLFLIFGPLIGGYFTEALSWRWIFWINLPLAISGLVLVFCFIPPSPKKEHPFDLWGFLFFVVSSSSLVIIIMQGGTWGWTSLSNGALSILFLISTIFLFWREKTARHPFIDLSLYRHPIYKAVNISIFATQFVLMITVYRAMFVQGVLGWSPLKSGMIFFVTSIPVLFLSPIAGRLADRSGSKVPIAIGFSLLIYSFVWVAFFIENSIATLLIGFFAFGIGIPLIFTPSYTSAMNSIPPTKVGTGFGLLATVRSLSACLGVAIFGSFASHVQFRSFTNLIEKNPETNTLSPSFLEGLSSGVDNIQQTLSAEQLPLVLQYLKESQIRGFFSVHMAIGLALMIAFAFVFVLYHRKASHQPPKTSGEGWD